MFTMKKKIVSGSLVALMALGLAGCANNSAAPASKVSSHPQTTKVSQSSKQASNKKASTSTSSSAQAISQSGSQASAKTQANYAAQSSSANANTNVNTSSNAQSGQVVNQFVKASGIKESKDTQYIVSPTANKGNYQVEVRDSQGDPNVSHLDGLYRLNPATNQVQQMDPVTGQFENK